MEKKVAVITMDGCEEGETLTIIDILRRADLNVKSVGVKEEVTGGHNITFLCDEILSEEIEDYDMIVLPGGYGGADNMRNNALLLDILKHMYKDYKLVCAMCAAPIVLDKAGLLKDKHYTAYVGYDSKIKDGYYQEDIVVRDGNLITSRAPATTYAFAYALVEALGKDAKAVKERMAYYKAFDDCEVKVYE